MTHTQLSEKVHAVLTTKIWDAVQEAASLEETWTPEEMRKRVVRYLHKAGMNEKDDLTKKEWKAAVRTFAEKAAEGYKRACAEKPWFEELNLCPALGAAGWVIAQACDGHPRPQQKEVEKHVTDLLHVQQHKAKVDKFMFEVVQVSMPIDEKSQDKFFRALSNSYRPAFEAAQKGASRGFQKAEQFVKAWISDTLCRSWQALENTGDSLTAEQTTDFFRALICPMDEEGVCCVPPQLLNGQERSSDAWEAFLVPAVLEMFDQWDKSASSAATAKRRKVETTEEEGAEEPAVEEEDADIAG